MRHLSTLGLVLAPALFAACASTPDFADALHSGPVLGDLRSNSVRIWIATDSPGVYSVEIFRAGGNMSWVPAISSAGRPATISCSSDQLYGQCQISGLDSDVSYRYRLLHDGIPIKARSPQTFRTLPVVHQPRDFRVAFGSCAGDWGEDPTQPIFYAIDRLHPDLFLWLGDNVYYELEDSEWEDPSLMSARWREQRAKPSLQALFARTPQYAIWDDHDYGPNNSDSTYPLRDFSLNLFTSYWPNPSAGLRGPDGVFFSFRIGPVEFFMLDTRYDRVPNDAPESSAKVILSTQQWRWLEDELLASTADFKVIASGMQVLASYHPYETWNMFSSERNRLLGFLRDEAISGVFFLSGDRHIGEALRVERNGTYPLVEFTSSPLAAGVGRASKDSAAPERIRGTLAAEENFGLLDFRFGKAQPELSFRLHDIYGEPLGREVVLRLDELQP